MSTVKQPIDDLDFALSCFFLQAVQHGLYGPYLQAHPEEVERALFGSGKAPILVPVHGVE